MDPVNADDLDWSETEEGAAHFRRKQLGAAAGGEQIGVSLYELPPGARSWPLHYHTGNEEAFYVLSGEGRLRTDPDDGADGGHPVEGGDYVACPADERGAHQLVNTGEEPLRYLSISTMNEPDVAVYPESETIGVFAGSPPGGDSDERLPGSGFYRRADAVDYWTVNEGDAGDDGSADDTGDGTTSDFDDGSTEAAGEPRDDDRGA